MPCLANVRITPNTSLTIVGSSAEVGSSNKMISGFIERHRAMAIRCFCPPDNWEGMAFAFSAKPTMANSSMARSSASLRDLPNNFTGPMQRLSIMERWLNKLNDWKTIPIFWRIFATSVFLESKSCPSTMILPPEGLSNKLRHRKKVLFPVPEGPMMEITSPRPMVALTSRSTCKPLLYVFFK